MHFQRVTTFGGALGGEGALFSGKTIFFLNQGDKKKSKSFIVCTSRHGVKGHPQPPSSQFGTTYSGFVLF